jgi:hypothetical protein
LILGYPFAHLLRRLPREWLKHLLSGSLGVLMVQWIYGIDWLHGAVTSIATYLLCLTVPRKHVHVVVFVFVMGYLVAAYAYRLKYYYLVDAFDFTRTQMVLTMKLTSFAFNLHDGADDRVRLSADADADSNGNGSKDSRYYAKVYADRRKYCIETMPSLLQFFGLAKLTYSLFDDLKGSSCCAT